MQELSDAELERVVAETPEALGSASIGWPSNGSLFNGVQLTDSSELSVVDSENAWGTEETVEYLRTAVSAVCAQFPSTPPLHVGHLSARKGGPLSPHRSHQSGRDVDLGYYYVDGSRWYRRAHAGNLDRDRTWALMRALITRTDVEMIIVDRSIQRLLREHARNLGADPGWLEGLFDGRGALTPLFRHAPGHRTHFHVRFYNPIAQRIGNRAYSALVEQECIRPLKFYVSHRVKKGETLGRLSKRYNTSVKSIKRANRLHSNLIRAGRIYSIPLPQGEPGRMPSVAVPKRRLPPTAPDSSSPKANSYDAQRVHSAEATEP